MYAVPSRFGQLILTFRGGYNARLQKLIAS